MSKSIEELERQVRKLESRVEFLEEQKRFTLDLLESASSLGDFQTTISRLQDPAVILGLTASRVGRLLELSCQAFFLVDERSSDFQLAWHEPDSCREDVRRAVDFFIDKGVFTWALKEKRPVFLSGPDGESYLLHVLATSSRVRGMFVALVDQEGCDIFDYSLALLSIVMLHSANALESFELYRWIQQINQDLEHKVHALASSEQELKKHRFHLQELVEERTTELNKAVSSLKISLAEKEILLKEIHHRVKNNLQIITSLLSLQARSTSDPAVREMLHESQQRVRSMALIHENLYKSKEIGSIDMRAYMETLVGELGRAGNRGDVDISLDVFPVSLDIDRAVPCGLILNELISNCFKHAFPDGQGGRVTIAFRNLGDHYEIATADDGVGLPRDFATRERDSLGLLLVETLADQLFGEVSVERRNPGTRVGVRFPHKRP